MSLMGIHNNLIVFMYVGTPDVLNGAEKALPFHYSSVA